MCTVQALKTNKEKKITLLNKTKQKTRHQRRLNELNMLKGFLKSS